MIIFQQIRDIQNQRFDKTVLKSKKLFTIFLVKMYCFQKNNYLCGRFKYLLVRDAKIDLTIFKS